MRLERQKYVLADPKIMKGKPVFVGTRIPVAAFMFASDWLDWLKSEISYPVTQPA
jgi:uncharacterized protein (DUF433 family)